MKKTLVLLVAGMLAMATAACGSDEGASAGNEEVTIQMGEYVFDPSEIHVTVGDEVTLTLTNAGSKDHELMAGRVVHEEDGIPHGFESDFFDTVDNLVIDPPDALETEMEDMGDMADMADETTMGDMSDMDDETTTMGDMDDETTMVDMSDEDMGHMEEMGVMVVREPTQTATITFTVTEASVGEWEIGCFEEDGTHWEQGMRGKIIVDEA